MKETILSKRTKNRYMSDFQIVSRRQVELAMCLREYRRRNNISQNDFVEIANIYSRPYNVKFTNYDISVYERYLVIPGEKKMNVLLAILGIQIEDLDYERK